MMHWKPSPKWVRRWGLSEGDMAKEDTLRRVQTDIEAGNIGRARDRLHGLIWQYPNDLSLRARLAEVYWQLRFPAMAGCYWYLEEPASDKIREAQAEFERFCGRDPLHMLQRLKFRGDAASMPPYAREKLLGLQRDCERKHGCYPDFSKKPAYRRTGGWKEQVVPWGCVAGIAAVLVLAAIGLVRVLQWLFLG